MLQVLTKAHNYAPLTLLVNGIHDISGDWSARTSASEIWLEAEFNATLSGELKIYDGAPPIHIKGFEITARIVVEALAPLEISDCKFRRAVSSRRRLEEKNEMLTALLVRSGHTTITSGDFEGLDLAIHVQGGTLAITDSNFRKNKDSIYVTNGSTRIINTTFNASRGIALHAIGGDVVLKNKTMLLGHSKQSVILVSESARVRYELPAPLGRYAYIQDSSGIYHFIPGEQLLGDFPFACSAGIVGDSSDARHQSSPGCARVCPAGHYCSAGTVLEQVCENGTFCPMGSPATQDCPAGRVGMRPLLASADECDICPNGTRCPKGTAKVELCAGGTYAPKRESESCTDCDEGYYQDEKGKDNCKICSPGKVCPRGSSNELDCFAGTWSGTQGRADRSDCKPCELGMFCPKGSFAQTPCDAGTVGDRENLVSKDSCKSCEDNTWSNLGSSSCDSCRKDHYLQPSQEKKTTSATASVECVKCLDHAKCNANGVTLETIELEEGWWRLGPRSVDLHKCDKSNNFTSCRGGNQAGANGSGYCFEGYMGPLCQLCTNETKWFNPQSSKCEECPQPGDTIGQLVGMAGGVLLLLTALVFALKHASHRSLRVMRARKGLVLCARRIHHLATEMSLVPKFKVRSYGWVGLGQG